MLLRSVHGTLASTGPQRPSDMLQLPTLPSTALHLQGKGSEGASLHKMAAGMTGYILLPDED